ncbi:hypothetical protein [Calidifontibacillus oryziterrae]|uniref:hypothetical protein n=1 Tax=Calidifontibacillus oryziterrae TaxID=1191699 RepID=UPI0002EA60F3|nr:hypothetical protein [Calidifontibacillus oryziterrae]
MSESHQNTVIPSKVIDLLVNDIFQKNGINLEDGKGKLSVEDKQMIKELVEDLRLQVEAFLKKDIPSVNSDAD